MFWFLRDSTYSRAPFLRRIAEAPKVFFRIWLSAKWGPIGVHIGDDAVKVVQLTSNGKSIDLIAGGSEIQPENIKTGSGNWQRWAVQAIRKLTENGKFRGKNVLAAMPADDVFIDHIKMPKMNERFASDSELQDAVFSKIKHTLPFEPNEAMVKCIPAEENNVVVLAAQRKIIDRHLAIYEKANLQIKTIGVWPIALVNSYTKFFGRRKTDIEAVVMLLEMDANRTNVVICRYKNLLFARSIPIGTKQFDNDEIVARLMLELTACRRHFGSMYRKARIERLVFLTSQAQVRGVCERIARQMEMPAQIGDCLAAVKMASRDRGGIDRRNCQVNWTTAFGLSLS